MNDYRKNSHTFDMYDYFTGQIFVLGGRDFEKEEKEYAPKVVTRRDPPEKKLPTKLDWSFLTKPQKSEK